MVLRKPCSFSRVHASMKRLLNLLKKVPIDLGQGAVADYTEGKEIAKRLTPSGQNKRALDVGARFGEQTRWLQSRGFIVSSVDIEPKFSECECIDANEPLPFDDETFDFVWCSEVIEHLRQPEASLKEFLRVLKPRGRLVMTTPNSYMWLYSVLNIFGLTPEKLQRDDHIHFFDLNGIESLTPNGTIHGYFPYVGVKFTIRNRWMLKWLTPTFVICVDKS